MSPSVGDEPGMIVPGSDEAKRQVAAHEAAVAMMLELEAASAQDAADRAEMSSPTYRLLYRLTVAVEKIAAGLDGTPAA